jgi:DNA-binding MurR/RpiR family transcriptional regulator
VAVLISNSGKTKEIVDVQGVAKAVGATTIWITKFGNNPLSDNTDISLQIASTEIAMRSGATSSRIAQLCLIDILFIGFAGRNYDEIHRRLENNIKFYKDKLD